MRTFFFAVLAAAVLSPLTSLSSLANGNCPRPVPVVRNCSCNSNQKIIDVCQGINGGGCDPFFNEVFCGGGCGFISAGPGGTCGGGAPKSENRDVTARDRVLLGSMRQGEHEIVRCGEASLTLEEWLKQHPPSNTPDGL